MARGESGRIVIEVAPALKRELYVALAMSGSTLKDWFVRSAEDYCRLGVQGSLFAELEFQSVAAPESRAIDATKGATETQPEPAK